MTTGIVRMQSAPVRISGAWCPRCGEAVRIVRTKRPDMQDGSVTIGVEWYCKVCDESGTGWVKAVYDEVRIVSEDGDYTGVRRDSE